MARKSPQGVGDRARMVEDRLGATSAPAPLSFALGSCAAATGSLSSSSPASHQPLHFRCSSADLPLVIMPEPKSEVSAGWPGHKSAPYGRGGWGTAVTSTRHVLQESGYCPGVEAFPPPHVRLPEDPAVHPAGPQGGGKHCATHPSQLPEWGTRGTVGSSQREVAWSSKLRKCPMGTHGGDVSEEGWEGWHGGAGGQSAGWGHLPLSCWGSLAGGRGVLPYTGLVVWPSPEVPSRGSGWLQRPSAAHRQSSSSLCCLRGRRLPEPAASGLDRSGVSSQLPRVPRKVLIHGRQGGCISIATTPRLCCAGGEVRAGAAPGTPRGTRGTQPLAAPGAVGQPCQGRWVAADAGDPEEEQSVTRAQPQYETLEIPRRDCSSCKLLLQ